MQEQELRLQLDALKAAGCGKIYKEQVTGATRERPELQKLLDQLRGGGAWSSSGSWTGWLDR